MSVYIVLLLNDILLVLDTFLTIVQSIQLQTTILNLWHFDPFMIYFVVDFFEIFKKKLII